MQKVQKEIKTYMKERAWDTLRPGDLAKSISIEAAELLENFQWDNPELETVLKDKEKIKKIEGIDRLLFDPPRQVFHTTAQHNLRPDFLHSLYLKTPSDFMLPSENLAEAILRHSLPVMESKVESA